MYIVDELRVNVKPKQKELIGVFRKKVKVLDNFNENPHLLVRLNATHAGFVNNNKAYYIPSKMRNSADTWIEPYKKPVLKHHDAHSDPIGKVIQAVYMDQEPDPERQNTPQGYIQLLAKITDEDGIAKISDGRLNTVSVGGGSNECWCSICGQDLANDGICTHTKGRWYTKDDDDDTEYECYWIIGAVDYKEVSFVNKPADPYGSVVNMELSTDTNLDGKTAMLDFSVGSGNKQILLQDFIEEKIDLGDSKENNMTKDKNKETAQPEESTEVKDIENNTTEVQNDSSDENNKNQNENQDNVENNETEDKGETTDNEEENHPEFTDEELEEIKQLDEAFDKTLDELAESLPEFKDAKLSAAQRKELPDSAFCGPNRSFPVPDCAHVTAARRLIGKASVSDSTKKKILACVNRKAKNMSCGSSKKSEDSVNLQPVVDTLAEKVDILQSELDMNVRILAAKDARIADLEATQERLLKENTELRAGSHEDKAKEVLKLKIEMKKPDVKAILEEEDESKSEALQNEMLEKLTKRSTQSLDDSLNDLRLEYEEFKNRKDNKVLPPVTNPGVVNEDGDEDDNNVKDSDAPDISKMSAKEKLDWFLRVERK